MQRYRRQVQTGNPHVLDYQRIHTDTVQIPNHPFRFGKFFFFQDRIHRNINTYIIQMGILCQGGNIFQGIDRCRTRTKLRRTYIHRIRTMIDSLNAAL